MAAKPPSDSTSAYRESFEMFQASECCSVCLDDVDHSGERSTQKLKCGHHFHLDCIGSAFNAKEAMQCPNCRQVEGGRWLYPYGPSRKNDDPKPPSDSTSLWREGSECCSVCLDDIDHSGKRSTTQLKCSHHFHLDCIISAFNAKRAMQCPNCRNVEAGRWLCPNGPTRWNSNDDVPIGENASGADLIRHAERPFVGIRGSHGLPPPSPGSSDSESSDLDMLLDQLLALGQI